MRSLIATWTAVAALLASGIIAALDAVAGTPWPLLALRAGLAFGIVGAIGWCVGYVLLRTALRRHYEQSRMSRADTRPRPER